MKMADDYPRLTGREALGEIAQERLDEAVDALVKRYRLAEETRALARPGVRYSVDVRDAGWFEPRSGTVVVGPDDLSDREFYAEEAAHWLHFSLNEDESITSVHGREGDLYGALLVRNLQEFVGRYAANILTKGRPARHMRDYDDYSGYDLRHRFGYAWADAVWRGHGGAHFREFLLMSLDEAVAHLDALGFSWE